ncbi:hypothetical protein ZWY2020_048838 [Hordeum vulgare]|nr:hypothetical protein ZWY2020_048838 [Hordeum vulgare]
MAFVQRRKGFDAVGSFGLLQPLADGLELILKEPISPSMATFMLSLVAWAVIPFDYGMVSDPKICLFYLFAISSLVASARAPPAPSSSRSAPARCASTTAHSTTPKTLSRYWILTEESLGSCLHSSRTRRVCTLKVQRCFMRI